MHHSFYNSFEIGRRTYFFFMIYPLECINDYDCPNGGKNYICNDNTCECVPGSILLGYSCVGMMPFFISPETIIYSPGTIF